MRGERTAVGRAPGKLLLLGEHAVVYGARAIGLPLDRGVTVRFQSGSGKVTTRLGPGLEPPPPSALASPAALVARALGPLGGALDVDIELDIPPMSGCGSSAALAVALLRARADWLHAPPPTRRSLWAEALEVEREAHAHPSGVDPAVVSWGQPIVFRRRADRPKIRRLRLVRPLPFVAGWCGSHGGTRHSVTGLAVLRAERPRLVAAAMATLGEAARTGQRALETGAFEPLGPALDLAHGVLAGLGLVTAPVEAAVRAARAAGALGAKMSGAGGAGGAWIGVFPTLEAALAAAAELEAQGFSVLETGIATSERAQPRP